MRFFIRAGAPLILSLGLAGCGPSAKEIELQKQNEALTKQLADIRQHVADTQEKLDAATKKLTDLTAQAKVDTGYRVLKKTYTEGALVDSGLLEPDTQRKIMKRVSPSWMVYFQGVQTQKEYPGIEVKEDAYKLFTQGEIYSREDIAGAKK